MAGGNRPSITRRHGSLQSDRDAVLQHVAARRRHGAHRPALHEATLELPNCVSLKGTECRPRGLRDLKGVREVGSIRGGVEERRQLHARCVRARPARAADVGISISLQAHSSAIRTDMAAEGRQVDAMHLGTSVLDLEVQMALLRPPPGVLAHATWSPRVAQRATEGTAKRRKSGCLRRRRQWQRRWRVKIQRAIRGRRDEVEGAC